MAKGYSPKLLGKTWRELRTQRRPLSGGELYTHLVLCWIKVKVPTGLRAAKQWIRENVEPDAIYLGASLAVEHRYAADLAAGMCAVGLVLA
jgi:hypothetical protein